MAPEFTFIISKVPAYPLDDFSLPTGGVILKSSDGVEFKVYKNILALASPLFREMFTLPQSIDTNDTGELMDAKGEKPTSDVQVVDVTETSKTLDILLRMIYPTSPPSFPGVTDSGEIEDAQELVKGIEPVLAAALKYDMQLIVKDLCAKLIRAADTTLPDGRVVDDTLALRVFVIACKHGLREEARLAAHASLKGSVIGTFIKELREINAAQYFHLLLFHQKTVASAESALMSSYSSYCHSGARDSLIASLRPILQKSPRSGQVSLPSFLGSVLVNYGYCCTSNANLHMQHVRESIDKAIVANDIDVSEI